MTEKNPNKISIESLLELKKAEKPAPEFWDGFQKDFHQRRLQSMIQKRSFMDRLSGALASRSSLLLPLSASAVALFVLAIQVRDPEATQQLEAHFYPVETAKSDVAPAKSSLEVAEFASNDTQWSVEGVDTEKDFVLDTISPIQDQARSYETDFASQNLPVRMQQPESSYVSYTLDHRSNYTLASTSSVGGFDF